MNINVNVTEIKCPLITKEHINSMIHDIDTLIFEMDHWNKPLESQHGYTTWGDLFHIPLDHWVLAKKSFLKAFEKIVGYIPDDYTIVSWGHVSTPNEVPPLSWHIHKPSIEDPSKNSLMGAIMYLNVPLDKSGRRGPTTEFLQNDGSVYLPPPTPFSWFFYDSAKTFHRPGRWLPREMTEKRYVVVVDIVYKKKINEFT